MERFAHGDLKADFLEDWAPNQTVALSPFLSNGKLLSSQMVTLLRARYLFLPNSQTLMFLNHFV